VKTVIRTPDCREYRRKKGQVECERSVGEATLQTSQGESRSPEPERAAVVRKVKAQS
jgi:hypothetical protein